MRLLGLASVTLVFVACTPATARYGSGGSGRGIGNQGDPSDADTAAESGDESESSAGDGTEDTATNDNSDLDESTDPELPCEPSAALALCGPGIAAIVDGAGYADLTEAVGTGAAVINVCPGIYDVELTVGPSTTLRSASGTAEDTVLTGGGVHPIVWGAERLSVNGLTFRNGWSDYAGGALVAGDGFEARCSVFADNYADYEGGALALTGDASILGSEFTRNDAAYEGGALSWGDWSSFSLRVEDSQFLNNHAGYEGGAIEIGTWADDDQIDIVGSTFSHNSDDYSDGIVNFGSWGGFDGRIEGCSFDQNDVAIGANGWLRNGYTLDVTNTTFEGESGTW